MPEGLVPRLDDDVMECTIAAVHQPRWAEWETLQVPTLAVFAEHGMFTPEAKDDSSVAGLLRNGWNSMAVAMTPTSTRSISGSRC